MSPDHRSAHPSLPGVPWWGAIVIAVTASAIGFAFDAGSGDKELTFVFSCLYVIGCVVAVLAVRQAALFTAVVQPPLILFIVVPGSYWLFGGAGFPGMKEIAINCGYPLIERFPLMLVCSVIVLVLGLVRWYFGLAARKTVNVTADDAAASPRFSGLAAKFRRTAPDEDDLDEVDNVDIPRKHTIDRPTTSSPRVPRTPQPGKNPPPGKRAAPSRSRHARPPLPDAADPAAERPRRAPRRQDPAAASYGDPDPREPRRRPRAGESERRPREPRRRDLPPLDREFGRPADREPSRSDSFDPSERRPRRRRPEGYEPYEPPKFDTPPPPAPPRRRPSTTGTNSTHLPFTNVRYRGAEDGESQVGQRSKPRARHRLDNDDWRYQG